MVFAGIALFLQSGLALGIGAADSLFLAQFGAERLPWIYLLLPVVMIFYIPTVAWLQSRYSARSILIGALSLIAMGAGLIGSLFLFAHGLSEEVAFLAKLFGAVWYVGLYTLAWNFIDSYFDISQGKRLYGIINGGASIGAIFSGILLSSLAQTVPIGAFFLLWAVVSAILAPSIFFVTRHYRNLEGGWGGEKEEDLGPAAVLKTTAGTLRGSTFALLLALFYFSLPLLSMTVEYLSFEVIARLGDAERLAQAFGRLFIAANAINLIISLFFFDKLVTRFGVRNLVFVQPLAYLVVFALFAFPLDWAGAILGFLAYQALLPAVDNNNANFLFNALPYHAKHQLRTFIEGIGEPLAVALAGGFLLIAVNRTELSTIALIGGFGTVMVGIIALGLNRTYLQGVGANLKASQSVHSGRKHAQIARLSDVGRAELELALDSGDPSLATRAIDLWWMLDPVSAASVYVEKWDMFPSSIRGESQRIFEEHLWLSPDNFRPLAITFLERTGPDPQDQERVGEILSRLDAEPSAERIHLLVEQLNGSESEQIEALRLLEAEVRPGMKAVARKVGSLFHKSTTGEDTTVRVIRVLRRIGDPQSVAFLFGPKVLLGPRQAQTAQSMLVEIGPRCVPILASVLWEEEGPASYAARSLALQTLTILAPAQVMRGWLELLERDIARAQRHMKSVSKLRESASHDRGLHALCLFHEDAAYNAIVWILELLHSIGIIPNHRGLEASLNSQEVKERANAVERVEESIGPRLFRRVKPLFDYWFESQEQKSASFVDREGSEPIRYDWDELRLNLASDRREAVEAASLALYTARFRDKNPEAFFELPPSRLPDEEWAEVVSALTADADDPLTMVEKISILAECPLFQGATASEYRVLANHLQVVLSSALRDYLADADHCQSILIVAKGTVHLHSEGQETILLSTGGVIGLNRIANTPSGWNTGVCSDEAVAFLLEVETFLTLAERFPQMGFSILRAVLDQSW